MQTAKMKIYISGPVTGTSDYIERFAKTEKHLSYARLAKFRGSCNRKMLCKEIRYGIYL